MAKFCEGCGRPIESNWKHCPACGTPVPNLKKEEFNPVFTSAHELAESLMAEEIATSYENSQNSDWDEYWAQEFDEDRFRVLYIARPGSSDDFKVALDVVINDLSLSEQRKEKFPDLESVQTRVVDDGWYVEVTDFDGDSDEEALVARLIEAAYGGEIIISKPKKS